MRRGRHYATFTLRELGQDDVLYILAGVVGSDFEPSRTGRMVMDSGWILDTRSGRFACGDGSDDGTEMNWEGQPENDELKKGGVVVRLLPSPLPRTPRHSRRCAVQGMLLDLDAATLTVYVNGERKGVMVRPGMTDPYGEPVPQLEGPLRWAVDLDGEVKIDGPLPPPTV